MNNAKQTFYILTYGCQMNEYDSRIIATILSNDGYKETTELDKADIIIINTCSVREHAEQRALGRISELQGLRKRHPNLVIGVVGCMTQNLGTSIKGADFIVGPSNYRKLPEIIDYVGQRTRTYPFTTHDSRLMCLEKSLEFYSDVLPEPDSEITAFVPVMYGCSNFCSYCIVPYVRGQARSRPYKDILRQIELLVASGVKEITLLGQSVNEYQDNGVDFPQLLRLIDEIASHHASLVVAMTEGGARAGASPAPTFTLAKTRLWIKFATSHPKNMSLPLIDAMKETQGVCKWLHLPMQAGSNKILKLMNRKYTKEEYLDWIYKVRETIPEVSITTDIMVGFPGEEEVDFNETLELVKLIRFDFAYMFKYSEREKTSAYHMEPKVPEEAKGERLSELINVQNKITYDKNCELVGTTQEVLVLGKAKQDSALYGRTQQNKVVVFDGDASLGDFVKIKISELRGWTPYGK